jgi:VWFA-related protein
MAGLAGVFTTAIFAAAPVQNGATTQNPPPAAAQQQPVFRGGTNLVTVDVYPQRRGTVVEGLKASDFQVFEDGKPQKVEAFDFIRIEPGLTESGRRDPNTQEEGNALASDPRNRVFVLYLDVYNVSVEGSHRARRPVVDFLNRILAPTDLFGVMTPLMRPQDLILGRRTLVTEEQLTRFWPWGMSDTIRRDAVEEALENCYGTSPNGGGDWMVSDGAVRRKLSDILIGRYREDATLSSLEQLMTYLGAIREARKSVIVLTSGWLLYGPDAGLAAQVATLNPLNSPATQLAMRQGGSSNNSCAGLAGPLANLDDQQRMRRLVDQANRNNVTFYPVSPDGLQAFDTPINQRVEANPNPPIGAATSVLGEEAGRLRDRTGSALDLAKNTDGIAIVNTNDLGKGLQEVVDDVSAYYVLGYYSTNTKQDGKYRHISVKIDQPDVNVRARRGYFAPTPDAKAGAAPTAAPAGPSPVAVALDTLARLRPDTNVYASGTASASGLTIAVEVGDRPLELGQWSGGEVQLTVSTRNGDPAGTATGTIEADARGTLLHVPLAAGAAGPWEVRVLVTHTGEPFEGAAEITRATGPLLGDPLVFRGTPSAHSALQPVADIEFRRQERVHLEWPVLTPLDSRTVRVLDRRGQPLPLNVTVTERPAEGGGGPVLAADVNLAPLAPGDYLIEVTAGAGGQTVRRLVAIRLVQ